MANAATGDTRDRRSLYTHICAAAALAALAIVYAWPLLAHVATSIPGTPPFTDVSEYVWSTGWVATALSSDKTVFATDTLFVPFGADLRLNTFGLLQGLMAFPISRVVNVVAAFNLVLVFTLALNGITGYALTFDVTRNRAASFVASSLFMLSSPILQHIVVGRSALGAMWLVAGALLLFRRTIAHPAARNALLLGGLLIGALLTDFQILLFSALWLLTYGAGLLYSRKFRVFRGSQLFFVGLSILPVSVLFALLYAPVFSAQFLDNFPQPTLTDMSVYSLRWWDFVTLDSIPYVYGYELGALTLIAIVTFRNRGEYRLWFTGAVLFAVLALGPFLRPTQFVLPFAGFSFIPALKQFRTPYRLIMPAQIGLMVVAAYALAYWLPRIGTRSLRWLFCGTIAIANLLQASAVQPFRTQTYPDYDFYRRMALEPENFTLLEVPFGIRSGLERIGNGGEVVQYYQHLHGKRLLNGSMARVPSRVFQFYRTQPALMLLSGQPVEVGRPELDRNFAEVLRWSNSRYVMLHRALMTGNEYMRVSSFLNQQTQLRQIGQENDMTIYKVF